MAFLVSSIQAGALESLQVALTTGNQYAIKEYGKALLCG